MKNITCNQENHENYEESREPREPREPRELREPGGIMRTIRTTRARELL